jgi:hypothetical protein
LIEWRGVDLADDKRQLMIPIVDKYLMFLRKVKKVIEE